MPLQCFFFDKKLFAVFDLDLFQLLWTIGLHLRLHLMILQQPSIDLALDFLSVILASNLSVSFSFLTRLLSFALLVTRTLNFRVRWGGAYHPSNPSRRFIY